MSDLLPNELPEGWEMARIAEKFSFTTKPKGLRLRDRESIPFVPMDRLPSDCLYFSDFVLRSPQEIATGTFFEEGDFLLSKITPCFENGKQGIATGIPGGYGIATTEVIPIKPIKDVSHLPFLAMYLLHPDVRHRLAGRMEGATGRQRLPKEVLEDTIIPFPPLLEQHAIVAVLWKIQAGVEVQEKIVATRKELKAATMAKLFREGLRGEPLKQTETGKLPESWSVVKLGDYCSISSGGTPSRDSPEYWNGDIPWVKTGEIDYRPIRRTEEYISEAGLQNYSAKIFPKGTLLMAMYGQGVTRGKVAFLEIEAATNQACAALFPKEGLDSGYLYSFCTFAYDRIRELGHGANQKNLSADLIREIRVPLPSTLEEQREIYLHLNTMQSRLQVAEQARDDLRALFSSVLRLLMTGQVRVSAEVFVGGERTVVDAKVQEGSKISAREPVPQNVERFVSELVRRFQPDRVILFGQHAKGGPRAFGEVGFLVEMEFEGLARDQAVRIAHGIPHDFSLDLVVRRPEDVARAVEIGDAFIKGVLERGRTLHHRPGGAPSRRERAPRRERPPRRGRVSEETLREIVQRIAEAVQPEKVILFGSAARGEMGPDSDVDLLVVKPCANRRETATAIYRNLRGVGAPIDIVVVTPEDIERDRNTIGYIIRPALREGRVVYAA